MSQTEIERELAAHLIALAPSWETKFPGVEFTPVATQSWQRGTVLWSRPAPVAWGSGVYSRGEHIYQVDLFHPRGRVKELLERAEAVRNWFFPATRRGPHPDLAELIDMNRLPAISRIMEDDPTHNRVMVEVFFYADDAPAA